MKCPFCSAAGTRVINSRPANGGDSIRRRRECDVCRERFTTFEAVEQTQRIVVKRDNSRAPYQRERLIKGLEKACKKRPVSTAQIETVVNYVEKEAFKNSSQEVTTEQIGRLVLKRLKDLDQVAYIRFASVYKQFRDLHDFNTEIKTLLKD
ncbi:transcriptional repressor NrdR [Candidatus Sumerlaeota bacterium]|nr:transcriptional repressor NrdR [Candidatus Sumerlaeota bacterium]